MMQDTANRMQHYNERCVFVRGAAKRAERRNGICGGNAEGGGMMRGAERTRRRLRTELHRRGIRINRLPEYIPYAGSTCYKYLNGSEPMTEEFAFQVQRVIDQWDNRKSARP